MKINNMKETGKREVVEIHIDLHISSPDSFRLNVYI